MTNLKLKTPGRIYKSPKSKTLEKFNKENKQRHQQNTVIYVLPSKPTVLVNNKATALVIIKPVSNALQKYK